MFGAELKKGSVELLVLSLVSDSDRHGYEIGTLIEQRSAGKLEFRVSTLYPVLRRLEAAGHLRSRWVEEPGMRRRRFYALTRKGRTALAENRRNWAEYVKAVNRVIQSPVEDPALGSVDG